MRKCIILTSLIMAISIAFILAFCLSIGRIPSSDFKESLWGCLEMAFGLFIIILIINTIIGLPFLVYAQIKKVRSIFAFIMAGIVFSLLIAYLFYPIFDSPHLNLEGKSAAPFFVSITISLGVINCILLWWLAIKRGLLE